ncbi:hypothetical protein D6B99_01395 [Arachidicoccus soli]|uniref:Uncharacterized protein n=1 Tax=Arachidicoccus soli TaxID=2341117 RepID=A0A386HKH3_9BACT|nr:hypothetical protein D6B99_01395 [Arachidicoccus soli]
MQRRAVILYESDNAVDKLPEPTHNIKLYENQVYQFFLNNPNYENYTEIKLSPLPKKSAASSKAAQKVNIH